MYGGTVTVPYGTAGPGNDDPEHDYYGTYHTTNTTFIYIYTSMIIRELTSMIIRELAVV